jgi:hypothetical protein
VLGVGWQAAIAGAIAGFVGLAEIVSRYRSSPVFSMGRPAAWGYVFVNVVAGVLALYLVRAFGWTFGQTQNVTLWRILVAGFGALALFRSSLFTAKIGSTDVNVGPSVVLGAILDACDRAVDRQSAQNLIAKFGDEEVNGLNPAAVSTALPVLCLALMQNFAPSDQALLAAELNKVQQESELTADAKMRAVLIQLAKYLGPEVVENVLKKAKDLFTGPGPQPALTATPVPTPMEAAEVVSRAKQLVHQQPDQPSPPPEQSDEPSSPGQG